MDAYVLAGGASSRMGRDKASVAVDGVALVERVAAALAPWATVHVVRRAEQDPGAWRGPGGALPVVVGAEGDRHPLWGVAVALGHARSDRVVVAACDLWALTPAAVGALLAHDEAMASDGARSHLLMVLRRERVAAVRAAAAAGTSLQRALGDVPRLVLPGEALRQANRPEDLPAG